MNTTVIKGNIPKNIAYQSGWLATVVPQEKPYWIEEADQIKKDEGFKSKVYLDTRGFPTVGVGHLLSEGEYKEGDQPFSEEELEEIFVKDLYEHSKVVEEIAPKAPKEVKKILSNMSFNLGKSGVKEFKNMLKAIDKEDYKKAADEMKNSKWYNQVGNRAQRLEKRMRKVGDSYDRL